MKSYFVLNENVILIQGAKRGLLQDLNCSRLFSIDSNSKYYLNKLLNGESVEKVLAELTPEENNRFKKYLDLLISKNLGYYSSKKTVCGNYTKEKVIDRKLSTVWFELRKACNLNCCHCYMDCNSSSDKGLNLLNVEDWKRIINQLKKFKPKKIILIGGEPLLFNGIIDIINYCKKICSESELILYSNLTLLTEKIIQAIVSNKVKVITSIYSNKAEIHDKITRKDGSFNITISNIKKLKEFGVYVKANSAVMSYNFNDISEIQDYIYELTGVRSKIDIVRDVGISKKNLIPSELETKFQRIRNKPNFKPVNESQFLKNYSGNNCWQGKINITCDGYVSPCIMGNDFIDKRFNIRINDMNNIIDNYLITKFWSVSKDFINECKDCEYKYVCNDCRPICTENGDIYSKGKMCNYNPYLGEWKK
ncbi:radical SAM protein [Clostridium chromiireducens]|uniref:Antilisterial bacteriocin subtilosin biosynthesis protein AlbA n=1 Tax=Clostridium chromiireducens TaxID=225345 RepID=A0A1V4ID48_9CLOT|nr:radical SAM protein [Clostridium chromiireducens]OPJ57784.1 antilisterial bacteriocin subtilosin biosynthesis protein AlbA [Clostridium chromiireducens]